MTQVPFALAALTKRYGDFTLGPLTLVLRVVSSFLVGGLGCLGYGESCGCCVGVAGW